MQQDFASPLLKGEVVELSHHVLEIAIDSDRVECFLHVGEGDAKLEGLRWNVELDVVVHVNRVVHGVFHSAIAVGVLLIARAVEEAVQKGLHYLAQSG